jgi:ribosomal protein S18 acetylase RimI-like enzyme
MMSIRPANLEDQEAVIKIWVACDLVKPQNDPAQDFLLALKTITSDILVLEGDGGIVGAVMVGFDGHRGWYYYLGVEPELQSVGNGRLLIEAAEKWLQNQGAPKGMLMVRNSNSKVIGFYKKLGYNLEEISVLGKRF